MRHASVLLLVITGCAGEGAALDEALCARMPSPTADFAVGSAPGQGPDVFSDASTGAVTLTLNDDGTEFLGFVTLSPDAAGTYAIGLSEALTIALYDGTGEALLAGETADGSCDALEVRHTWDLLDERNIIELRSPSVASVVLAVEAYPSE